jgi:hypothetical protein
MEGGAVMLATVVVEVMVLMVAAQPLVLLQAEEEMSLFPLEIPNCSCWSNAMSEEALVAVAVLAAPEAQAALGVMLVVAVVVGRQAEEERRSKAKMQKANKSHL